MRTRVESGGATVTRMVGPRPVAPVNPFVLQLRQRWRDAPTSRKDSDMGFTITPVAPAQRGSRAAETVEVPDEVSDNLEELWRYMEEHPNYTAHVKFDKDDDPKLFAAQARSWAATREVTNADGKSGALTFRQLPARNLPDDEMRFSLSAPLTVEQEKARDEESAKRKAKRDEKKAADEVKASAGTNGQV